MDTTQLPYRLKTARRKRRLLKEDRDKQLLRMEKEYKRLEILKKKLPYVPLDVPYQRGWKRLWVLRPETAKSEKAGFYQEILDKLTEVQCHYDKSFKQPKRKGRWHRYYFETLPRLRVIDEHRWASNLHKLSDEQRILFKKIVYWDEIRCQLEHYYQFDESYLFEIAVRPHIIDRVKLHDGGLVQEMAFINDKLYKGPLKDRFQRLSGGYYKYWKRWGYTEQRKYLNPLKNKPLHKVLEEYC